MATIRTVSPSLRFAAFHHARKISSRRRTHALIQRVLHRARDLHHDGLLHLRAGHDAGQFLTTPALARFLAPALAAGVRLPLRLPQFALAQQRLDARQICLRFRNFFNAFGLAGGELEAQPENLLGKILLLRFELVWSMSRSFSIRRAITVPPPG